MFNRDNLEKQMNLKGWTKYRLAKEAGIGQSTLHEILSGKKTSPNATTLSKLATALGVNVNVFFNEYEVEICEECGDKYCPGLLEDFKKHELRHNAYKKAVKKFGKLLNITEREDIKKKSREILEGIAFSIDEKYDAALALLNTYFSRSVQGSCYNENHVGFDDFVAMLLAQNFQKDYIPNEVYDKLIKRFGIKEGIKEGSSYYETPNKVDNNAPYINTIAAHFDGKDITPKKMKLIEQYIDALFDEDEE